jgi:hypothetical protein
MRRCTLSFGRCTITTGCRATLHVVLITIIHHPSKCRPMKFYTRASTGKTSAVAPRKPRPPVPHAKLDRRLRWRALYRPFAAAPMSSLLFPGGLNRPQACSSGTANCSPFRDPQGLGQKRRSTLQHSQQNGRRAGMLRSRLACSGPRGCGRYFKGSISLPAHAHNFLRKLRRPMRIC